jgi:hypothetical protein
MTHARGVSSTVLAGNPSCSQDPPICRELTSRQRSVSSGLWFGDCAERTGFTRLVRRQSKAVPTFHFLPLFSSTLFQTCDCFFTYESLYPRHRSTFFTRLSYTSCFRFWLHTRRAAAMRCDSLTAHGCRSFTNGRSGYRSADCAGLHPRLGLRGIWVLTEDKTVGFSGLFEADSCPLSLFTLIWRHVS